MKPQNAVITEVIHETPTITTLKTDIELDALPGQFVMVWVRGLDEVPMALSHPDGITVQKVGEATAALSNMQVGDSIGIRGPFGNGFKLEGNRILIIAGGVGGAPLLPLARVAHAKGLDVTTIIGARTGDELLFEQQFSQCGFISVATDDGSKGHCGLITELMDQFDLESFEHLYVCGPEMMMDSVLTKLHDRGIEMRSQFSLHRYFKCGIGVCGACTIDPSGLRVCKDGPVFQGDMLINSELGKWHRDATGERKRLL
ncbi:MAG: dihydroorotate dehydrogenase electron transfer subunit [Methanosarcinales archaeon]|nr:dihydroorotate dehydrogenase electron transfer subunit [Methanosarcinales archaeon]